MPRNPSRSLGQVGVNCQIVQESTQMGTAYSGAKDTRVPTLALFW